MNSQNELSERKAPLFGIRHRQCFLLFFGFAMVFALRANLSVAIVVMTDKHAANPDFPEYEWSEQVKSLLLSSFFWGYIFTQVPGGYLARKFGGKILFLVSMTVSSSLALLTPFCADKGGWKLICGLRLIQGLAQGVLFPTTHTLLSKWATPTERGAFGTYCYSGCQFGTVVMLSVSGFLASSPFGWPSIFYVSGLAGLIWSLAWAIWGSSSPSECKAITTAELKYLESALNQSASSEKERQKMRPPWSKFFTSPPFLILIFMHCSINWGFWTLMTQIPTYMKNILNLNIKSNALLSALPYFTMFVLSFVFVQISILLNKRCNMSLSTSRKLFNTIGQCVPVVPLILLGYVGVGQTHLAITLLTVTVGVNAAANLGFAMNHIDLSPNFAGILMGISNCVANVMSICAPLFVGFIVTDEKDPAQWRIVFFIAAGFYFIGNLLFVLFGKTDPQPWNDPPKRYAHPDELVSLETKVTNQ